MSVELTVKGKEVLETPPSALPENPPAKATTTTEEDRHTASQREVNLIWENTQKWIALGVVATSMVVATYLAIWGKQEDRMPTILSVAFGTVVGFYFGRTNHQKIGGVQLGR